MSTGHVVQLVVLVLAGPTGAAIGIWQHRKPKRRTLAELLARARWELERNPTITVYEMVDGQEVRRPTDPWLQFRRSVRQIGQAFVRVEVSARSFSESLQRALAAMPEPRVRRPEGFLRYVPSPAVSDDPGLTPAPRKPVVLPARFDTPEPGLASLFRHHGVPVEFEQPARHPDLDVFDAAVAEFESRMDCPHDSSSGGYGPERTWRCDECGEITGREPKR